MVTQKERMETAVALAEAEGGKITITFDDVKKYICPDASDAEIGLFLKVCASEQLNPFRRECFLVKYAKDQPAAIIISTEAFLKAAESCPEYDGHEAGIILKDAAKEPEFREGAFLLEDEEKKLVGGWARVYRKDRAKPIYVAVNIKECMKHKKGGDPTRFWEAMPATMVRKVALSRALREAFPNRFAGTLTTAEFEEIPEGQLPPAFEKNGKPDWRHFWVKVKSELGLTPEEARLLLGVDSIKEELIDKGWTPGRVWDELVKRRQQSEVKADEVQQEIAREAEVVEAEVKKQKRDPETIQTINDLLKACNQDFKMQPKDVYKELGYKSASDINEEPSICYQKIAAVRR
jgi:phage recombination protein Bet